MIKKCLFIAAIGALTAQAAYSQKKSPARPAPAGPKMVTKLDSVSYIIGNDLAVMLKSQGLDSLNMKLLFKAMEDNYAKKKPILSPEQSTAVVGQYIQSLKDEKGKKNKAAGEAFLAKNKTKPGVTTLPSGLQYQVLTAGTGPKPSENDRVKVHYHGTLIDGTVFDSSVERGEPLTIGVSGVIRGWTEALLLMPVGSKWRLFIPSDLGYGERQAGQKISPNSVLIFDVELLNIEAGTPAQ
ncbi:FKBP-type peptidyl-prolyl cis-trans isomerase [Chitinophaga lutea]